MVKALRFAHYLAAGTVLIAVAAAAPAIAQFPPSSDDQRDQTAAPQARAPAASAGPNIMGSWAGQLNQVGVEAPYKLELVINAKGGETRYPDLNCSGKLTRVGSSKSYAFFVEVITKGQADKGGRCPDGTITLTRQGNDLTMGWFGSAGGNTIIAYGTLKKK
jgi:hypothetical protein